MSSPLALAHPKLLKLRPTQMSVGFAEVEEKLREWREVPREARDTFLIEHAFPSVLGPGNRFFITDHHHLGVALIREEVERCSITRLADLSALDEDAFWAVMDHKRWAHPYDAHGKHQPFGKMPDRLTKLKDDPFRSLAAEVRRKGGFAKETAPFAEFLWADFFRRWFSREDAESGMAGVVEKALALCHTAEARHLPGWSRAAPTNYNQDR